MVSAQLERIEMLGQLFCIRFPSVT